MLVSVVVVVVVGHDGVGGGDIINLFCHQVGAKFVPTHIN